MIERYFLITYPKTWLKMIDSTGVSLTSNTISGGSQGLYVAGGKSELLLGGYSLTHKCFFSHQGTSDKFINDWEVWQKLQYQNNASN